MFAMYFVIEKLWDCQYNGTSADCKNALNYLRPCLKMLIYICCFCLQCKRLLLIKQEINFNDKLVAVEKQTETVLDQFLTECSRFVLCIL